MEDLKEKKTLENGLAKQGFTSPDSTTLKN